MTIEERVAILEGQIIEIEEDISILIENDNFLFDEQVIQDERLFSLEQTSNGIISELDLIEDDLESEVLNRLPSFSVFLQNCLVGHNFLKINTWNPYMETIYRRSAGHNTSFGFPSNSFGGERRG